MSELRQDPVSGEWIIIAPGRVKRPTDFRPPQFARKRAALKTCPFEDIKKSGNWPPISAMPAVENWRVAVVPNKYPSLMHPHENTCAVRLNTPMPYKAMSGVGHNEIVVTRDHDRNFFELDPGESLEVLLKFKERILALKDDKCLEYVSVFQARGPKAGASIYHPHYQIYGLPIIPPDVRRSLEGSLAHYKAHKRCVHCSIIATEAAYGERLVYENGDFIAFAPFVSRQPFEVRIYPKRHEAFFEKSDAPLLASLADGLGGVLGRMHKNLNDPDYLFFLHTAPLKHAPEYENYHWHIEVLPKTSTLGGLEWGTGIIVNTVDPDKAAQALRK